MAKYKLRKGVNLGALAAENDQLLANTFIDSGYLTALNNPADAHFLIVGRTGTGKTALIKKLIESKPKASVIDPEELSMQYLINSSVLKLISDWGVNLEPFFKFLWRHVCILELIRMRYAQFDDIPSVFKRAFSVVKSFVKGGPKKTQDKATEYLDRYADEYWIKADTRIKTITEELETTLHQDAKISATLAQAGVEFGGERASRAKTKIEQEVLERTQAIVSGFLIAELNKVISLLEKHAFTDKKEFYFMVVDDLDKNWMPNDTFYLDLIKSLLFTVNELNHKLKTVKIIVALRENIFVRIFEKTKSREPQREKLDDIQVRIKWERKDLIEMANLRLAEIFKEQYRNAPPTLEHILPPKKKKIQESAITFILDRTFLRPRDLLDFLNNYIEASNQLEEINWKSLYSAELIYSKKRLDSVHDEWKDSYYGLPATYDFLKTSSGEFKFEDLTLESLNSILTHPIAQKCSWLSNLMENYTTNQFNCAKVAKEICRALFTVGIIGIKYENKTHWSYENHRFESEISNIDNNTNFQIHKMFRSCLGIVKYGEI